MEFLSYLISGISLGSIYAIIALGYTMVYGIAKMLNFAHGDIIMIGGYVSFCSMYYLNLPPIVATLLAVIACTVASALRPLSGGADHRHRRQLFPPELRSADLEGRRQDLSSRCRRRCAAL